MRRAVLLAPFVLLSMHPTHTLAVQAGWTITRDLRIGSVDDDKQALTSIGGVTVSRDGKIYVAQPQDQQFRIYSATGELLGVVGRKGGGPAEFEGLSSLSFHADTVVAFDLRQGRLSLFTPDGELLRTLTIRVRVDAPYSRAAVSHLLPDGTGLATASAISASVADGTVRLMPLMRVDRTGVVLDTVLWHDASRSQLAIPLPNGAIYGQQPFSDEPIYAQTESGFVLIERTFATAPREATFRVFWIGFGGDTIRSRTYRYTPRPVPSAHVDSIIESRMRFLQHIAMGAPELEKTVRSAMPIPRFFAPVLSVHAAPSGEIWLERGVVRLGTLRYTVLSRTGDILADVDVPPRTRIVALHGDHLYTAERDDLDVPYVVRYRVNRGGRR